MELAKDTRDRIFTAADALYEQGGREVFPTVDAVRKSAKVNMNDASAGMKEWRRAQTAQAAPVTVQVPDAVRQVASVSLTALWQEAQELANESLRAAQAGWESERAESDTLSKQLADAYEAQAVDLNAAMARIGTLEAEQRQMAELAQEQNKQLEQARADLAGVQQKEAVAQARIDELRAESTRADQDIKQARDERDKANAMAIQAREQAAHLSGQIQALQEQVAALLARINPQPTDTNKPTGGPIAPPKKG